MIYERVVVQPGLTLRGMRGYPFHIARADLVLGVSADGERFRVLKDRYGDRQNVFTLHHPCPCGSGRRLGTCHGRDA